MFLERPFSRRVRKQVFCQVLQGIFSNRLCGDELRPLSEMLPKTIGEFKYINNITSDKQLKEMSSKGCITAKYFVKTFI